MLNTIFSEWEFEDFDGEVLYIKDAVAKIKLGSFYPGDYIESVTFCISSGKMIFSYDDTIQDIVWLKGLVTS